MNRSQIWLLLTIFTFTFVGCAEKEYVNQPAEDVGAAQPDKLAKTEPAENDVDSELVFVVDHYDPDRDAVKDLEMTTELAGKSGKRILIEVGGKW